MPTFPWAAEHHTMPMRHPRLRKSVLILERKASYAWRFISGVATPNLRSDTCPSRSHA
jgi:hypothetical protein